MCASGLNDVTAPLALAAGARGVGIGSMINKLPNSQQVSHNSPSLPFYLIIHFLVAYLLFLLLIVKSHVNDFFFFCERR